jgi:hypothetical protein
MKSYRVPALIAAAALAAGLSACSSSSSSTTATTSSGTANGSLVGVFKITAGSCSGSSVSGSYFRMVQSGGTPSAGPFVANGDSTCATTTYTPLSPGTEGGLITGSYQSQPSNPFDASKNGVAAKIIQPVKFFAVDFALSSNPTDPQSGTSVPAPSLKVSGGKLSGNLSALSVAWNGQQFNQGAPKPGGSLPGNTVAPSGTYDSGSGAYTLDWSSQIVGGPFNGFTGVWHLVGTFSKK